MTGAVIHRAAVDCRPRGAEPHAQERIRHLPVRAAGGELLGIVTDRDIRLNLPSQATSLSGWEINHHAVQAHRRGSH